MIDWLTSLRSPAKEAPTVIEEVSRERRLADWDSWFMKKPHWACLMLRFFVQGVCYRTPRPMIATMLSGFGLRRSHCLAELVPTMEFSIKGRP